MPLAHQRRRCFLNAMSRPYEEIIEGATLPRSAPGERHEKILAKLHREIAASINGLTSMQLLPPRTSVAVSRTSMLCPDLALVTVATGKLFLAVEVISRDDHRADTVVKKEVYEQHRVSRLWMVDPRYDNVEVYHSFEFGLKLQSILAGSEELQEKLIPHFKVTMKELFAT
jgi:hypothetical protein